MNRLAREKSPYLLQHRANPVDWYPWGEEAFAKARREERPIFLSIGYSTCHWCHVMERESFEDDEVARYLNEHFVAIKVDREERPDIDAIYMAVTQAMTGHGGWPMSVFLTPDRRPFFAGTYFPPDDRYGRMGFPTLLRRVREAWTERRAEVLASSESITDMLRKAADHGDAAPLDASVLARGCESFARVFDQEHGGFGGKPKFPRTHDLLFLLRFAQQSGDMDALAMVTGTLDPMMRGGIYDHVGGGFHRYATDRIWLVPHFEKMLYDQALIARTYVEAYQSTGVTAYADTARDILAYVLRDLTSPEGGFYSAEDADSEGVEGKFYTFARSEVLDLLGPEGGALWCEVYGASAAGNYHEEATGEHTGLNIFHLAEPLEAVARRRGETVEALRARLVPLRQRLFEARERRIHPLKDDKVLADWNGLMVSALAGAASALDEPRYAEAARRAASFVLGRMRRDGDGRLLHRFRDGEAAIPGHLDDYAFLCLGLCDLYEATFEIRWLDEARALAREMVRLFWDAERAGFWLVGRDAEVLIAPTKELYDGAVPSGNSVATLALLRLGRLIADPELERTAARTLEAFSGALAAQPRAYTFMLLALDFALGPAREVVIVGDPAAADTQALVRVVRRGYAPNQVVALKPTGEAGERVGELLPFTKAMRPMDGRAAAYVCEGYACREPATSAEALERLLAPSAAAR